jgi:hypothetical protein
MTWIELICALIFVFLAADAYFVLKAVREAVGKFVEFQGQALKAQLATASIQIETFTRIGNTVVTTCSQLTAHHIETLQSLSLAHESRMDAIRETHGQSAESLRLAASASADATVELRHAAQCVGKLLADSNLFAIQQHLFALRKFFVGKNES